MVGRVVTVVEEGKQHVYKIFASIRTRVVTNPGTSNIGSGVYKMFKEEGGFKKKKSTQVPVAIKKINNKI